MENTTMKINCWEFEDGNEVPMLSTATLDGFEWNGKFRITVPDDDGSLGLPFLFATDDTAILTVETTEQEGMGTDDKKIKQVISCVPRFLGNEITCSRTRSYKGKEHVWSAWETISSASGAKDVVWGASSCVDTFVTAGVYNINGQRLNVNDALPIANSNPGHTISARLVVLDCSIAGTGDEQDKCITQMLTLSNRTGGDGDVYIRTGRAHSTNVLAGGSGWEPWGKLHQNIEVGQVTSLDTFTGNGIYSGVYTNGSSFFETFVMVVINNYAVAGATGQVRSISQFKYALNVDGTFSYKTRTGRGGSSIEWGSWVDLGAASTTDIQDNSITVQKLSSDVREKVEKVLPLEENVAKEKTALLNGDTVVGLAREVYSRQGKTDTATFLKRTTAGGTSISDGVATLKQIGGNIVNNKIIDKPFASGSMNYVSGAVTNVICPGGVGSLSFTGYLTANNYEIPSHIYYVSAFVKAQGTGKLNFSYTNSSGLGESAFTIEIPLNAKWEYVSCRYKSAASSSAYYRACSFGCPNADSDITAQIYSVLYVDLTEMYGAGNEPDKATCDRLFGTMDALPQGLTIAKPAEFKSIGYNQWNPANLFTGKTVADNAIVDGENSIAFFECLPCKIGVGENNGYVIGYGEGDDWGDAGIEVYLTPIYPMTGDGLLYAHKLEKDATTGTYVPKIKGYLLVVTPVTDKLCAHFLWSGDRSKTDYEPYIESNLSLPQIPEMSEWGLAAISVRGTTVQDIIDLENKRYKKSIGYFDIGSKVGGMVGNIYHISIPDAAKSIAGVVPNLLCAKYKTVLRNNMDTLGLNTISQNDNSSTITLYDSSCTTAEEYAAKLKGVMLYYELAIPEEYPIVAKSAPNYIGSDYGVEVFMGSKVPLNANILFYMRSLVSETRVFIDRLMAGLGVSDATVVADRIIAAIRSHNAVEEGPATE